MKHNEAVSVKFFVVASLFVLAAVAHFFCFSICAIPFFWGVIWQTLNSHFEKSLVLSKDGRP
jgi:hypothetical protein